MKSKKITLEKLRSRTWASLVKKHRKWEYENLSLSFDKSIKERISALEAKLLRNQKSRKTKKFTKKEIKKINYDIKFLKKQIASWNNTGERHKISGVVLQQIYGGHKKAKSYLYILPSIRSTYIDGPMGFPLWSAFSGENSTEYPAIERLLQQTEYKFIPLHDYANESEYQEEYANAKRMGYGSLEFNKSVAYNNFIALIDSIADCANFLRATNNWTRLSKFWEQQHLELEKALDAAKHELELFNIERLAICNVLYNIYEAELNNVFSYILSKKYLLWVDQTTIQCTEFDIEWLSRPSAWYALFEYTYEVKPPPTDKVVL